MKTAFYTRMEMDDGNEPTGAELKQIVSVAHSLGYELVPFEGWTDVDLGMPGNPGPRKQDAKRNGEALREICDACEVTLHPHFVSIFQV